MPKETSKKAKPNYPWAELYDMESHISSAAQVRSGKVGRPPRIYTRRRTSLMLSDEEQAALDKSTFLIHEAMRPASVTKSQVYGLAVRLLEYRLKFLPNRATSWDEVIQSLFEGE